nr:MAG TPA: hypothetical protein [Bacteriophage sp.]
MLLAFPILRRWGSGSNISIIKPDTIYLPVWGSKLSRLVILLDKNLLVQ